MKPYKFIILLCCFFPILAYGSVYDIYPDPLLFKARVNGSMLLNSTLTFPDVATSENNVDKSVEDILQSSYGFDTSATIFLTHHFAVNMYLGANIVKLNSQSLLDITTLFPKTPNSGEVEGLDNQEMVLIPLGGVLQYHLASPSSHFRPYVGVGYGVYFIHSNFKPLVNTFYGHGICADLGVDFEVVNNVMINISVNYRNILSNMEFKNSFASDAENKNLVTKMKANDFMFYFGISLKL